MVSDPPERLLGSIVDGRYTLTRVLGHGGFGSVFEAEDMYGTPCAVKLVPCERAEDRRDALREAALMREHAHDGIVALHDSGRFGPTARGFIYLAMELCGETLHDRLRDEGPLPPAEAVAVLLDVAGTLAHLHARGVVHGDVKPGNVIRAGRHYKLCDLGAARELKGPFGEAHRPSGTPEYMAPEAFAGEDGPAVDIWALGMVLHEAVTGKLPFAVKDQRDEVIARLVRETAPRLDPALPAPLAEIVRGCLSRDPALRWTAERVNLALVAAAQTPLAPPPRKAARPRAIRAFAGAMLLLALAALALATSNAGAIRSPDGKAEGAQQRPSGRSPG